MLIPKTSLENRFPPELSIFRYNAHSLGIPPPYTSPSDPSVPSPPPLTPLPPPAVLVTRRGSTGSALPEAALLASMLAAGPPPRSLAAAASARLQSLAHPRSQDGQDVQEAPSPLLPAQGFPPGFRLLRYRCAAVLFTIAGHAGARGDMGAALAPLIELLQPGEAAAHREAAGLAAGALFRLSAHPPFQVCPLLTLGDASLEK